MTNNTRMIDLTQISDCAQPEERRLPFEIKVPNATTLEAMAELEAGKGKRFASVKELMADLNADDTQYYTFAEIIQVIGVSRQTIQRWRHEGKFPAPFKLGPRTRKCLWPKAEIEQWVQAQMQNRCTGYIPTTADQTTDSSTND